MTRTKSLVRAFPLLLGAALVLSACGGGGGGSDGVASLDADAASEASDSDGDGGSDDAATPEETEEAFRKFAHCLREHGVDAPDPQTTEDGRGMVFGVGPGGAADDPPSEAERKDFEEADKACRHHIDGVVPDRGEIDPEEEARMRDQALAFAKCMRDHGIDMPDPTFGEGGTVEQRIENVDPRDEDFRAAEEACSEELDFGPEPRRMTGSEAQ